MRLLMYDLDAESSKSVVLTENETLMLRAVFEAAVSVMGEGSLELKLQGPDGVMRDITAKDAGAVLGRIRELTV